MKYKHALFVTIAVLGGLPLQGKADFDLGTAGNFAVLAATTITNTGASFIDGGDVGVSPGTAITGFDAGTLAFPYTTHEGDPVASQAQKDLLTAYTAATLMAVTQDLTDQDLGGLTLLPGVYHFLGSAHLAGTLTLDNQGDPNAQFVFQIGSTLITGSNSQVVTINGDPTSGANVFWQVGSSATIGADTAFVGHILAHTSITMGHAATILNGSALAMNAAVTMDTNHIVNRVAAVPEPATISLIVFGGMLLGLPTLFKKWRGRTVRAML